MIKITKLDQGVNVNIRYHYAQLQELRRKIKVQILNTNIGDKFIDGIDKLFLNHFISRIE